MRALVTGATGLIGRRLLAALERPIVLSRDPAEAERRLAGFGVKAFAWDPLREPAPAEALEDVDAVFHLAGEPIAEGRWTAAKKRRIRDSRVVGTRHLAEAISQLPKPPSVLVSASAVGYYGSRGDQPLDESAAPGDDFLAEVVAAWEQATLPAAEAGVRVVNPRIGIVLGQGGALAKMLLPFKLGLGSPLGNGRQWMSWIHIDDLVRLMLYAAEHAAVSGPVNATAPNPVTNREFTKALGRVLGRPTFLPSVPGFVLRIALGELAGLLLASQRAVPNAAEAAGYRFAHPQLDNALQNVLLRWASSSSRPAPS